MEKNVIEDKANELMRRINYVDNKEYIDIIDIAKKVGFVVGNASLKDEEDGFVLVNEKYAKNEELFGTNSPMIIGVNAKLSIEWKRFIIAHELAHYELHYDRYKGIYAHREHKKGKSESENEADFFAANLLMPRDKFTAEYDKIKDVGIDEKINILAKKFIVTTIMTKRRIEELELQ